MPQKKSMLSESFRRRSSFTLASVPAFSSALSSSIFRLPSSPPVALISSAANCWPLNIGSPSTAAGPVKKVIWPILNGLSRSEEHTSELQSLRHLVCRLLLEKKKKKTNLVHKSTDNK